MPETIIKNYIPPLTKEGASLGFDLPEIFPGVKGYAVEARGKIYIPYLDATKRGNGDVGKFLDALDPRCVIAGVINEKLVGMLLRRGWKRSYEMDPNHGEHVDVWSKANA